MPYFFSHEDLTLGREVEIAGQEARHILLAHRSKKGEKIKLQGPNGRRYLAEIISTTKTALSVKALGEIHPPPEPLVYFTLFQSVVNEKALDFIFQKGTELGLGKVVLFNSANTATKLSDDSFQRKQERWNKILIEAAKQCERAKWPSLEFVPNVNQALLAMEGLDKVFLTDVSGDKLKANSSKLNTAGIIVGPEGGLATDEISRFKSLSNLQTISLGPILLRAETAALASLVVLQNILN